MIKTKIFQASKAIFSLIILAPIIISIFGCNKSKQLGQIIDTISPPKINDTTLNESPIKLSPNARYLSIYSAYKGGSTENVYVYTRKNEQLNLAYKAGGRIIVRRVNWTVDNNLIIHSRVQTDELDKKNPEYLFYYKTNTKELIKLGEINTANWRLFENPSEQFIKDNPFYFLYNGSYTSYNESVYFLPTGQRSTLYNARDQKKQIIGLKKGYHPGQDVLFSSNGSNIIFQTLKYNSTISAAVSDGIWLYDIIKKNLKLLDGTKKASKEAIPVAVSNDDSWLMCYFPPIEKFNLSHTSNIKYLLFLYDLKNDRLIKTKLRLKQKYFYNLSWLSDNKSFLVLQGRDFHKYELKDILL